MVAGGIDVVDGAAVMVAEVVAAGLEASPHAETSTVTNIAAVLRFLPTFSVWVLTSRHVGMDFHYWCSGNSVRLVDAFTWSRVLRWVHIGAGSAWLGEVVVVVFVLVPVLIKMTAERRIWMLKTVFPRIFRLASVLSLTAVLAGAGLYLAMNDWNLNLERLVSGQWGLSILIGGTLGLALTVFHFVVEGKLEPVLLAASEGDLEDERIVRFLAIVPRIGLGVLVVVFGAMMYAAKGI